MKFYLLKVELMTAGIKIFRKILSPKDIINEKQLRNSESEENEMTALDPYVGIFKKKYMIHILKAAVLSLLILAVSGGTGLLVNQLSGDDSYFMVVVILLLTTLGIIASFFKSVRNLEKSYDAGLYLVYIFCVVVASMADVSNLDFRGGFYLLLYVFYVVFLSLIIHSILAKLFRIDGDTLVISSVAVICSPPLVPMMAAAIKNKDIVITGLSIGIVGYALGNYFGFLMTEFLKSF